MALVHSGQEASVPTEGQESTVLDYNALLAENARLQLLADGKSREAYLMSAGPDYATNSFEIMLRTPMGAAIVEFLAEAIKAHDARNYISVEAFHPDYGRLAITVQKLSGELPAAKAARLEAELAALKATTANSVATECSGVNPKDPTS